jgi:hypothetical protein
MNLGGEEGGAPLAKRSACSLLEEAVYAIGALAGGPPSERALLLAMRAVFRPAGVGFFFLQNRTTKTTHMNIRLFGLRRPLRKPIISSFTRHAALIPTFSFRSQRALAYNIPTFLILRNGRW